MESERTLFINPTKQCNVNCIRCFLTEENRNTKERIEPDTLLSVINHPFFRDHPKVTVIWEGGEPSLIGRKNLSNLMQMVNDYLPQSRQIIVSNLFSTPDWVLDLSDQYCNREIETTFAFGDKYSLSGSEDLYIEQFEKNLKRITDKGYRVYVNVEVNRKTLEKGMKAIVEMKNRTGCKYWEFDISVDFLGFLENPNYDQDSNYPILTPNISYKELSDYLTPLFNEYRELIETDQIRSSILEIDLAREKSFFNVIRNDDFITLNPDGSLTTDPLFSDLIPTYIGNVKFNTLDECLRSKQRRKMSRYESTRAAPCLNCEYFDYCMGGSSHVPINDGSGECAGLKSIWRRRFNEL